MEQNATYYSEFYENQLDYNQNQMKLQLCLDLIELFTNYISSENYGNFRQSWLQTAKSHNELMYHFLLGFEQGI